MARDLEKDLALIEHFSTIELGIPEAGNKFIAAAREGWPYAIRYALKLEKEIDRLRNEIDILQEQLEQRGYSA